MLHTRASRPTSSGKTVNLSLSVESAERTEAGYRIGYKIVLDSDNHRALGQDNHKAVAGRLNQTCEMSDRFTPGKI